MAFMDQERKEQLAPQIMAICKQYGIKATLSVRHNSGLCLNIKSGSIDFLTQYNGRGRKRCEDGQIGGPGEWSDVDYIQVNEYRLESWEGKAREFLEAARSAMMRGNHDNSDPMTDYFDVGWYIYINVGQFEKPYIYTPAEELKPARQKKEGPQITVKWSSRIDPFLLAVGGWLTNGIWCIDRKFVKRITNAPTFNKDFSEGKLVFVGQCANLGEDEWSRTINQFEEFVKMKDQLPCQLIKGYTIGNDGGKNPMVKAVSGETETYFDSLYIDLFSRFEIVLTGDGKSPAIIKWQGEIAGYIMPMWCAYGAFTPEEAAVASIPLDDTALAAIAHANRMATEELEREQQEVQEQQEPAGLPVTIGKCTTTERGTTYFEADCGKTGRYVHFRPGAGVSVYVKTQLRHGIPSTGTHFRNVREALAAYKSLEMQAIISLAERDPAELQEGTVVISRIVKPGKKERAGQPVEALRFTVGRTYYTRSTGDHNCIHTITIAKRTEKTVTTNTGKIYRPKVRKNWKGEMVESISAGNWSMAHGWDSDDTKELLPDWKLLPKQVAATTSHAQQMDESLIMLDNIMHDLEAVPSLPETHKPEVEMVCDAHCGEPAELLEPQPDMPVRSCPDDEEDHGTDFVKVKLPMSWGTGCYRYSRETFSSGWPRRVEAFDPVMLEWVDCPNVNVHRRIAGIISQAGQPEERQEPSPVITFPRPPVQEAVKPPVTFMPGDMACKLVMDSVDKVLFAVRW